MKTAPEGKLEVDRAGMVLSGSVAAMLKLRFSPSVTDLAPIALKSGAWLPDSVTVMVTTSESVATPSVALKVILYVPLWVKSGVQLKVPEPPELSVKLAPAGSGEAVRAGVVPSASVAEVLKLRLTPSLVAWAPIVAKTGVWFRLQ